ncbi:MAG: WD40 repeat domain-containing protein, partial [Chloroflexota bacterium]
MWTVSFSETGRYLAAGGSSGIVTIWEVPEFEELRRFEGHVGAVWATDFSPNEDFLITGGDDAQVLRWDINSGAIAKRYRAHRDRVLSVAYLADGRELLSSSADGRIILWDANTALQREQYDGHEGAVWEVHPSGVAEQFISSSADGTAILWDETNGARLGDLASRQGAITTATYSPDGQFVAYGTTNRYIVQRSVTSSETLTFSPRAHTDVINDLAYSPDGQLLASAADNRVILWDAFFGAPRGQLDGHTDEVRSVMFDPVEPYLYSTGNDGRVIIWNYNTRELLFQFRTHDATVWDVAVGAGNEEMATVSSDRSVRLWENPIAEEDMDEEVEEPEEIELHTDVVRAAVYSPDGKWLATGGDDNTIFLHNIFSEENVLERRLNGHEYPVTSIAYSTDGQYLVSGDTSGTVIIWTSDGDAIRIYDAHRDEVTDVQFEPTGQPVVMSSSLDGLVIFWRADSPGDLRDWTIANRDVRELTCPEKEFYQQELDEDCIAELESGAIEPPEVQPTDAEQVARNEENTSE